MVEFSALEDVSDASELLMDGNMELYMSYIRHVELEFTETVDELLDNFHMSHLLVKSGQDYHKGTYKKVGVIAY